ncbi:beta-L-arabinofuranosidase domain-containing protein [Flavobacterium sp. 25HG05S-40]|uniref:beta-L-arabinofuranosidase domain-containing protein n=1 Tax=Flavobacterium sp. 25HG05S-40 TaxID=3458682 RepID=UPI004043C730
MRNTIYSFIIIVSINMHAQNNSQKLQSLPFGSIKPKGWLKTQMEKDVKGFVGNLDQLVPDLINDPIYGSGRLHKNSQVKDLGNLKEGDAEGSDQYKWWNSETQSNWWDGYIRNVFLLDDKAGIEKVNQYIKRILATQDQDGYLGIYDKELRYNFNSENGELWSKATLYRGLLAYYEATNDRKVWNAIVRAVDNVMVNYPINTSSPFRSGEKFNGGVSHGLTFTDVLDKMYQITGDERYTNYALFLYTDFSKTYQSECDVQLPNILNPKYRLKSHGVHTYEHLRSLIVATYQNNELQKALSIYLERIKNATTPTGGPIGDEWIAERTANATQTGYEYCSIQELLDSYASLLQKTGKATFGDEIETIFYNAAQGSRDPNYSCIAYLKTDNSYEMLGTKNGEVESDRKQTRYKYSPAHQDVAVCCNPNAGRISPYFIQNSWMKKNETTLVATLLLPNVLKSEINGSKLSIENQTNYPNENAFNFKIQLDKPTKLTLKIRKPNWVRSVVTNEKYHLENDYIFIERTFDKKDSIALEFKTDVKVITDSNGEHYFSYGSLFFAKSISALQIKGKEYAKGFADLNYEPLDKTRFQFIENHQAIFENNILKVALKNINTNKIEFVTLTPFGQTILRQVSF